MKDLKIETFRNGQIVEGEVVIVTDEYCLVNFGAFTEGTIYLNELTYEKVNSAKEVVKVGDRIKAKINKISEMDGEILLSRLPLEAEERFETLRKTYKAGTYVTAHVVEDKKSVLLVKVNGLEGIMPKNEVDPNENFDANSLLNKDIQVKLMEVKKENNRMRIVVSRKAVILHQQYEERLANFNEIEVGAVYEGVVTRIEKYGVIVVANNYQGLVPYREISHLPFNDISECVNVGDKVQVKVLEKDEKKLQVLYSIKELLLKPWEILEKEVKEGDVIEGTVVRMTDFGAFVNIMPKVDGLLHVNEYSHNPNVSLFDEVEIGQKLQVKVLKIDKNRERLSLSVKALTPNPWERPELAPYAILKVKVIGFKKEDAIIEYVPGVEGILPKQQISADKRITNASDELSIGQEIDVKVIEFDREQKVLVGSIRRIKEDAERAEFRKYMKEQENIKLDTLGDLLGDKLKEVLKK